ncbi:AbrB/MazE/SpoVT family DNA-binding domain-containing protein [Shinella sp. AETb1-6]|jgi:antitoxin ChpS|uniref:AbrB/MazE/SpoVT family DNA-binding domain-containing protein n=1 Tax=Shinella oryzae TaxID=2871820 RepID=A0ABY9K978_9HYPH|nr:MULTISPECIES: AbrB/MazE/SpoVT family DNA-binding domain-containing protein [Shinella]MXN50333.1 AbrB/MazE/SpoVT family DNA-binding domain-containing protein [Shinella sp. AETb1-6]WLS04184.1 AbrB/MazE/SpoVT family DNA-binding domain-containing protein [Shinella oryzae]WLS09787.1 AbrB/MazE/SpoVT family DNA-binding domain-containing protein [Shinella sumterensis]
MAVSTLRNVGGSVMMTIPKPLLEDLGLSANAKLDVTVEDGRLIAVPKARPKYTLDELIAEWTPWPERTAEEQEWLDMPSVGNEVID